MMPIARSRLVTESLNLRGTPYIWGAKGEQMLNPAYLAWAKDPRGPSPTRGIPSPSGFALDCSGAFGYALVKSGGKNLLWSYNTDNYWNELPATFAPLPGDAALYGGSRPDDVEHIEMVIALIDDRILVGGSSGGDSRTVTLEDAERKSARYKVKESHLYRPDFRGFRSVASLLLGQG